MYGIVLMAALTTGGEASDFGGRRCSCACSGCVVTCTVSHGCKYSCRADRCSCWGCRKAKKCHGCTVYTCHAPVYYGCHAATVVVEHGTCHGVVHPPVAPEVPKVIEQPTPGKVIENKPAEKAVEPKKEPEKAVEPKKLPEKNEG